MRAWILVGTLSLGGCGSDVPETYLDDCVDASDCAGGFQCLPFAYESGGVTRDVCSQTCEAPSDCPEVRTSHCGVLTSLCTDGVCGFFPCD